MTSAEDLQSGKGHRDENFPVASVLLRPEHRPAILAFYRFARQADDIADHAQAAPEEKLRLLEQFRSSLVGENDSADAAVNLRKALAARNLSPEHGLDLLEAFRRDVTVTRYADWNALMEYCRYSAMPVGRFMLDVHGESRDLWPANDALCAALQVINHLQDGGKDYRDLDRVYLPLDAMRENGVDPTDLSQPRSSPGLRAAIRATNRRTAELLARARPFAAGIRYRRLSLEVTVIQRFAEDLVTRLETRYPLAERVHHSKPEQLTLLLGAVLRFATTRRSGQKAAFDLAEPSS